MDTPSTLVSVIIPTRNRAELLKRSIASVLAQTHRNLELIVVNDASTDHTREVLAAIPDPRLKVIHREQNRGAAAARNAGLEAASAEWIAFQDDDDLWLACKLERQLGFAAREGCDWCICCNIRIESFGAAYIGGDWYIRQLDYSRGIGDQGPNWSLIATPGWLVRREALVRAGGFDERIRSWDDWELGLRLWQLAPPRILDEPLWVQDWARGAGLTKAERARGNDMQIILAKHAGFWRDAPRVLARHWYIVGRVASLHEAPPSGRAELWRSLSIWPFFPLAWVALAMSLAGPGRSKPVTDRFRDWRDRVRRTLR